MQQVGSKYYTCNIVAQQMYNTKFAALSILCLVQVCGVKCEKHETKTSSNSGNETETLLSILKVEYEQLTSDKNMSVTYKLY